MYSCAAPVVCLSIQKSRVSRLQNAKMAANRTFIRNKKKVDAFLVARETERERGGSGGGGEGEGRSVEMLLASQINDVDLFQLQHHHLLACLERTTVSRWMDGWMEKRVELGMDEYMNGLMDGEKDGGMVRGMDGEMDECVNGW